MRRATPEERAAYDAEKPVWPLGYWVTISGQRLPVEHHTIATDDEPNWEVLAPDGWQFEGEYMHTFLLDTLADVRRFEKEHTIIRCEAGCDCGWDMKEEA